MISNFLNLSSEITAFSVFELQGTGQADAYLNTVTKVIGSELLAELLAKYAALPAPADYSREQQLSREIFGDDKLGPITRNIIKLWYTGAWFPLPYAWTQTYGALEHDRLFMVSASAYTEGLLWPAIGANPPGAKAPGYGSWANPPNIPAV